MFVDRRYATNFKLIISTTTCLALLQCSFPKLDPRLCLGLYSIPTYKLHMNLHMHMVYQNCTLLVYYYNVHVFLSTSSACMWMDTARTGTSCLQLSECLRSLVTRIFINTPQNVYTYIHMSFLLSLIYIEHDSVNNFSSGNCMLVS